jgi:hypothetical protein
VVKLTSEVPCLVLDSIVSQLQVFSPEVQLFRVFAMYFDDSRPLNKVSVNWERVKNQRSLKD